MLTIDKGRLSLSLYDLFGALPLDEKLKLVDDLAVQDDVINEVCNQIIDGWTSEGSHGGRAVNAIFPKWDLSAAIQRIAQASSAVADLEIARLQTLCAELEVRNRKQRELIFEAERVFEDMDYAEGSFIDSWMRRIRG